MKKIVCAATLSAALAMAGAAQADDHPSHQFTQPQTGPTVSSQSSYTGSAPAELTAGIVIFLIFLIAIIASGGGGGGMAYPMVLTAG